MAKKKHWRDRRDARRIYVEDGLHAIFPHLMNKRTDAEVFVNMEFDVTEALRYIEKKNEGEEEYRATLFHCFLMALAKTVRMRPMLNRYISGRFYFERNDITLGFVAKKRFEDHSEETMIVAQATDDWTLRKVTERVVGRVHKARSADDAVGGANKTVDFLRHLPRFLLMFVVWVVKTLDFYGLVPDALREDDPNFSTVLLTNLGSIKCPAVYHHLNNYGTNSLMVAIGTIRKKDQIEPDGSHIIRDVVDVGFTLDERIADGFYFGRSLKIVQHLLSHPELLERPLSEEIDYE